MPERLDGLSVLVTAGPTREAIDPVRFISNRSSGKMGFAVAAAAAAAGARVHLVAGPVHLDTPSGVERSSIESARDMHDAVHALIDGVDIFVSAAAVADYAPAAPAKEKIKKSGDTLELKLVRCPDVLASVSARSDRPFCVGFAAETTDVERHARGKLAAKALDMIAANEVGGGLAFDADDNRLLVLWNGGSEELGHAGKHELARRLVELIARRYHAAARTGE